MLACVGGVGGVVSTPLLKQELGRILASLDNLFNTPLPPFGGGGFSGYAPFRRLQLGGYVWMCRGLRGQP